MRPALVDPDPRFRTSFAAAMEEFRAEGRGGPDDNSIVGRHLRDNAADWADDDAFRAFVAAIRADRLEETPRPEGYVPATELWWADGNEFLGRISIRHRLTPLLLEIGGHIGYDVRPSARRRGHATAMLREALAVARGLGIGPALLTCNVDNIGSRTVIERNGGVLEDERAGKLRFWVPTGPVPNQGPLAGLRIIDCSTVLAGPYCTMLLGDLGADVIKVEPPEGDATRGWGPPWVGDEVAGTRTAAYYLAVNRNKRSICLDLSTEAGRAVLRRLLRDADAVVENFRVGGFAKLGFSDDALRELNPRLIHLAISGFGTRGPDAAKPGYDFVIQAVGGLMSITGEPDGRPMKVGVAISDVVSGLFGAVSLLAALLGRERVAGAAPVSPAGGQRIDVSLLQSTLAMLVNQAQSALVTGAAPVRRGNAHPSIVPYETFATADGEIAIGVGSERQWARLGPAIGLPGLATEARFATNGDRVTRRDELIPILAARFAEESSATWLDRLDAAGIPAGPILDLPAAFASGQAAALGSRVPLDHPVLGAVDQVAIPFELSGTPASIRTPPPLLGEHTDEILLELADAEAGPSPVRIPEAST